MTRSLAVQLEDALRAAAGAGTAPVSVTVDYAAGQDADLSARGWIERATRSLVFVQAEARDPRGAIAGAASGVFRRLGA